ncbi:MAG: HlyD family efflux transporter periplasmic adaptor subunit [Salinarimonas sp.]|nr:HlyD family efflux transporter periplasmic adaptor subunit [Salinarimonas sp.]
MAEQTSKTQTRKTWRKRLLIVVSLAAIGALAFWAMRPQPIGVDLATIDRGDLVMSVEDEGRTRIRDIYVVSSPMAGSVLRSPLDVGDAVVAGETEVAYIRPLTPEFLDARSRAEAEAAIEAARAAVQLASAQELEASAEWSFQQSELNRIAELARRDIVSQREFDRARAAVNAASARMASAQATLTVRERELEAARARLTAPQIVDPQAPEAGTDCCLRLHAPITGETLAVHHRSETVVRAGEPLLEFGDPQLLEAEVELLSSEAVRVRPGLRAEIDGWGGDNVLAARVRRVESAGFTKVSALGIEEQRVRVVLDLEDPPYARDGLGHGYRIVARIILDEFEDIVRVPLGALFRHQGDWAVFVADDDGIARLRRITPGTRDGAFAIVEDGLETGERVILYPSDRIADGVPVMEREG